MPDIDLKTIRSGTVEARQYLLNGVHSGKSIRRDVSDVSYVAGARNGPFAELLKYNGLSKWLCAPRSIKWLLADVQVPICLDLLERYDVGIDCTGALGGSRSPLTWGDCNELIEDDEVVNGLFVLQWQ